MLCILAVSLLTSCFFLASWAHPVPQHDTVAVHN